MRLWSHHSRHVDVALIVVVPVLSILPQLEPRVLWYVISDVCMLPCRLLVQASVIVLS